jgi:aromatic ring-opening dioxygenase catalytic subunit (LigB family)
MPERAAALGSLSAFLRGLIADAGTTPRAIVAISGHWEEQIPTVSAREVVAALTAAGIPVATEHERGYDHGVFVPFMLVDPAATIPVVPLSLVAGLDPAQHIAIGRALAPLREDNVLIVGSGMSFHNLRALFSGGNLARADAFDGWLNDTLTGDPAAREGLLARWAAAPEARFSHPREEHLIPLLVAAGAAAGDPGTRVYNDDVMGAATSGFRFG